MRLQPNIQRHVFVAGERLDFAYLVHEPGRYHLQILGVLQGVVLVEEQRRVGVERPDDLIVHRRGVGPQHALEVGVVHVFVHDIPADDPAAVPRHHRRHVADADVQDLAGRQRADPVVGGVDAVPEDAVAPHGDPVPVEEVDHGVSLGVVLLAPDDLGGVPLELVVGCRRREAGGEVVLVAFVEEDGIARAAADGEEGTCLVEGDFCAFQRLTFRVHHLDF